MAERSSAFFRGNLMPRTGILRKDKAFLASIHDRKLLQVLSDRQFELTQQQKQEFDQYSSPCAYSKPGDHAFGQAFGTSVVVNKCLNTDCFKFPQCRPNVTADELATLKGNRSPVMTGPVPCLFMILPTLSNPVVHSEHSSRYMLDICTSLFSGEQDEAWYTGNDIFLHADIDTWDEEEVYSASQKIRNMTDVNRLVAALQEDFLDEEPIDKSELQWKHFSYYNTPSKTIKPSELETVDYRDVYIDFKIMQPEDLLCWDVSKRAFIHAGPGTGKTQMLSERIIDLVERQSVDPKDILVLCHSIHAKEAILQRIRQAVQGAGCIAVPPIWIFVRWSLTQTHFCGNRNK